MTRLAAVLLFLIAEGWLWSGQRDPYTLIDLTHQWDGLTSRVTSDDGNRQILIHTRKGTVEIDMTEETADRLANQLGEAKHGEN